MREHEAKGLYWRQSVILAAALLGSLALGVVVAVLAMGRLDTYRLFGFPLGFLFLAQGLVLIIAAAGFWYQRTQQKLDEEFGEHREY